jgi:predicted glutamine amidotransferase
MAHNGHIGDFDEVRDRIREQLSPGAREEILGDTDSEHFFQLALKHRTDGLSTTEAIRKAAKQVQAWTSELDGETEYFLNTLWGETGQLAGTKKERSLWYIEREEPVDCDICERPGDGEMYRSVVLASERITDEDGWREVPSPSVFRVTDHYTLETAPLVE